MGVWEPTKNGQRCRRHNEEFAKGGCCPMCPSDPPTDAEMAQTSRPKRAKRRRGLQSVDDHEREFVAIAELAAAWAREEDEAARNWIPPDGDVKVVGGPSRGTAAKLLDCSIKARRAAAELARWREDWDNTERLEKAAAELRRRNEVREELRH